MSVDFISSSDVSNGADVSCTLAAPVLQGYARTAYYLTRLLDRLLP